MIPPCPICGGAGRAQQGLNVWACVGDCGVELDSSTWSHLAEGVRAADILNRLGRIPFFTLEWRHSHWNATVLDENMAIIGKWGGENIQSITEELDYFTKRALKELESHGL